MCDAGRGLLERALDDTDGLTMEALLERLEALTERLDDQATRVASLEDENAAQVEMIERLTALRGNSSSGQAEGDGAGRKVGRRGMLRKIVGATAAAALLTVAKEAATAHADTRTTIMSGTGTTSTYGLAATNGGYDPNGFLGNLNGNTFGIIGISLPSSIAAPSGAGVLGQASGQSGVLGLSDSGVGVRAASSTYFGVHGTSGNYAGVGGVASAGFAGVWGQSQTGLGVYGESTSGTGIWGRGWGSAIGVYGESFGNHGAGGATTTAGFSGLFGYTGTPGAAAFLGVSGAAGGTAGYFHGAVTVDGPFQVVNGPKNALVAHPDGSHRRMYCQESPEPWFEDFGAARLQGGKATVRLDPDFAAVVKADDYEVFPVPKGECKGLYVANQTPASFEVRELQGGTSSIPFSYRLVARRKDDVGKRLEKVDLPKFDLRPPGPPATPPGQDKEHRR